MKKVKKGAVISEKKYKCVYCGYIYSPLRGEPHNGIPEGTAFDDLPDAYICPVCGAQGKGKIGKWGFEEWIPTKYICKLCGYVYDKERGEPHNGIPPGTAFEDLPDTWCCPECHVRKTKKGIFVPKNKFPFKLNIKKFLTLR
jgi:rubredoxin